MTNSKIQITISGRIAERIFEESKAIGESNNPQFWIFEHFNNFFKIDQEGGIKPRHSK